MGNHNSGRRPQPTALKLLRGNPSKTKPNALEPKPPAGAVTKPGGLSTGAAAVWDELAPICLAMGTLTVADVRVFGTLCELQASLQYATAQKAQAMAGGEADLAAVLKAERDTANTLRPYYALFGLEPISRAKIQVPKAEPVSKWGDAL